MKTLITFLIIFAVIQSCAPPQNNEVIHTLDTLQSIVRTDTGVFVKNSYILDGIETCVELRKAKPKGETEEYMRYAYGYDSLGNKILAINSLYNREKKDYVHLSKEEFEYDDSHNPTLSTLYIEKRGHWFPQERYGRTFDARGNVSTLETYEPQIDGWVIRHKTFYKYDNAGNITEKTDFRADDKGEWHPVEKVQREYQKSLMVLEIVSSPASGNKWAEKTKAEFEYNVAKQIVTSTSYIKRGNKWANYVQVKYSYDATGNITASDTYFWNEKTGRWKLQNDDDDF